MSYSNFIFQSKKLVKNLEKIKTKNVCAMVKANAYGVGVENVCKVLKKKVIFFGVSNLSEALNIRKFDKETNILIVGLTQNFLQAIKNNISITIENYSQIFMIKEIVEKNNLYAKIHIKVNTGMNRYGIKNIKELKKILKIIKNNKKIIFEGIFTHLFNTKDKIISIKQLNVFDTFIKEIPKNFNPIKHIGGGDAIYYLRKKKYAAYMLRVGYNLYKNVIKIESQIIKITKIKKSECVGYSSNFVAKRNMKIALVPLGYADGINRKLSNCGYVKIKNKNCKIVGNVCMDVFFVDVTNIKCRVGTKVVVFDNIEKVAKICGTIGYEILTAINYSRMNQVIC